MRLFFHRKNRLLSPKEYQRVFKAGRKQRGGIFTLIGCKNDQSCARLGLAIAKRNVPSAVSRNRIRRIIRESFRHHKENLSGVDVVVLIQRDIESLNNTSLHEDLNQQWQYLRASLKISS